MSVARAILALVLIVAMSGPARSAGEAADATLDILRETIRANKKALVAANLTLTDEEAGKFWALYDRYQNDLKGVNDRLVQVIQDYTSNFQNMTDEHALKLVEQYTAVEEDRAKLRRQYLGEFSKVLPGRKVARFYQIENKMDAVVRYDLAEEIPVIEEAAR